MCFDRAKLASNQLSDTESLTGSVMNCYASLERLAVTQRAASSNEDSVVFDCGVALFG